MQILMLSNLKSHYSENLINKIIIQNSRINFISANRIMFKYKDIFYILICRGKSI